MDLLLGLILIAILYAVISGARSARRGPGPLAARTDPSRPITPAALGGAHWPPPLPQETLEAYILRREDLSFLEGAIFAHYIWDPVSGWREPGTTAQTAGPVHHDWLSDEDLALDDHHALFDPDSSGADEFESDLWEFEDLDDYWLDDVGEDDG